MVSVFDTISNLFVEYNIFERIWRNPIFLLVIAFTLGMQVVIVQYGGVFTQTVGLQWYQWLICAGVGLICIPISKYLDYNFNNMFLGLLLRIVMRLCTSKMRRSRRKSEI